MRRPWFNYRQEYIPHAYLELCIPPTSDDDVRYFTVHTVWKLKKIEIGLKMFCEISLRDFISTCLNKSKLECWFLKLDFTKSLGDRKILEFSYCDTTFLTTAHLESCH